MPPMIEYHPRYVPAPQEAGVPKNVETKPLDKTHFMHIRPMVCIAKDRPVYSTKGGISVAFKIIDPYTVAYATARCSDQDHFNRKLGRTIADGRLNKGKHKIIEQAYEITFEDAQRMILETVCS